MHDPIYDPYHPNFEQSHLWQDMIHQVDVSNQRKQLQPQYPASVRKCNQEKNTLKIKKSIKGTEWSMGSRPSIPAPEVTPHSEAMAVQRRKETQM